MKVLTKVLATNAGLFLQAASGQSLRKNRIFGMSTEVLKLAEAIGKELGLGYHAKTLATEMAFIVSQRPRLLTGITYAQVQQAKGDVAPEELVELGRAIDSALDVPALKKEAKEPWPGTMSDKARLARFEMLCEESERLYRDLWESPAPESMEAIQLSVVTAPRVEIPKVEVVSNPNAAVNLAKLLRDIMG